MTPDGVPDVDPVVVPVEVNPDVDPVVVAPDDVPDVEPANNPVEVDTEVLLVEVGLPVVAPDEIGMLGVVLPVVVRGITIGPPCPPLP